MTYGRGSKVILDQWAELNNDSSWSWDSMQQYYEKVRPFLRFFPIFSSF